MKVTFRRIAVHSHAIFRKHHIFTMWCLCWLCYIFFKNILTIPLRVKQNVTGLVGKCAIKYLIVITVVSHKRHGISNHRQFDCFFSTSYLGKHQRKHQSQCYWSFVRVIYRWIPLEKASEVGRVSLTWRDVTSSCVKNKCTGPRLNIKTVLSTYGDFHVKDKTAVRTSYL